MDKRLRFNVGTDDGFFYSSPSFLWNKYNATKKKWKRKTAPCAPLQKTYGDSREALSDELTPNLPMILKNGTPKF